MTFYSSHSASTRMTSTITWYSRKSLPLQINSAKCKIKVNNFGSIKPNFLSFYQNIFIIELIWFHFLRRSTKQSRATVWIVWFDRSDISSQFWSTGRCCNTKRMSGWRTFFAWLIFLFYHQFYFWVLILSVSSLFHFWRNFPLRWTSNRTNKSWLGSTTKDFLGAWSIHFILKGSNKRLEWGRCSDIIHKNIFLSSGWVLKPLYTYFGLVLLSRTHDSKGVLWKVESKLVL